MHQFFKEAPLRVFTGGIVKRFSQSLEMHEQWDTYERPQYLTGILWGALQARLEGHAKICALEFGVASGEGLLAMQRSAKAVEEKTGVQVLVYGFDTGSGLTPAAGYKDHPDKWTQGDYPMPDVENLKSQLSDRTTLILGDVETTVDNFVRNVQECPLGFVAFDLDYYSSTVHALKIFTGPDRKALLHTPLYFDDTMFFGASEYAGELLAIREFNDCSHSTKIDKWDVLRYGRPFHERKWLNGMYIANDLQHMDASLPSKRPARRL